MLTGRSYTSIRHWLLHHLDPATKEFMLSRHGGTGSLESAREEARKCLLVCANCHAEIESGVVAVDTPVADRSPG